MGAEPMMSRRRFMTRTSAAIDTLVRRLALESSERVDVRARMARYNRDCGCALGGVTMVAALLMVIAYIAMTATLSLGVLGVGIAFIVVCSMLGKALGLVVASVRLELLRRSLSRRARRLYEESRVYVH
jgi:Mg/Co/Ni transporter MgtE